MKRRKFIGATALGALAAASPALARTENSNREPQQIYEFRRYTFKFGANQTTLHNYLKEALIPALNRNDISHIGAFLELGQAEPARLYVLIPYESMAQIDEVTQNLITDRTYQQAARAYHNTPPEQQLYTRFDTWLMKAFLNIPQMEIPEQGERIFELRTYEGYSEDAVRRKVLMFNEEELALFYKVKLNPVFFGHLISGPDMPALTYMLTFRDMEERDKNWANFIQHPEWNRMKVLPQYANTVSNIIKIFLKPTDYSQV